MEAAASAGLDPARFWRLTPFETSAYLRGSNRGNRWLAWQIEALHRAERLPDPAAILGLVATKADAAVAVPEGVTDAKVISLKAMKAMMMTGTRFAKEASHDE